VTHDAVLRRRGVPKGRVADPKTRDVDEPAEKVRPTREPAVGRMFAATVLGLGSILADEVRQLSGMPVTDTGSDGRSDIVLFGIERGQRQRILDLDVAEDVFVEVGRTLRVDGDEPRWIAGRIWRPERVRRAMTLWRELAGGAQPSVTFRVIVRVLQERSFLRTDLRRDLTLTIARDQQQWRVADPARLEVWIVEYRPGRFVAGLRVSDAQMRQHGGRKAQRSGALRPAVATAMVRQAGAPLRMLLDPCCGSGTLLAEAARAGWSVRGMDIDPVAVGIARRNVRDAVIDVGDARSMGLPDASVDACVSNLPFGRQYSVQGERVAWLRSVLGEMARVTRGAGRVVLLSPELPRTALPAVLRQTSTHRIRLLGTWTTMWCYDRTDRA